MDLSNICYTYVQLNVSMFFDENHVHSLRYWSRKHVFGGTVLDLSGSCFCLEEASGIYRIYQAMEGARRAPCQDYSQLYMYLTQSLWFLLRGGENFAVRSEALFRHAFALGLRHPSEGSMGTMTALLGLSGQGLTTFQAHMLLQSVRGAWKNFTRRMRNTQPAAFVEAVPSILHHEQQQALQNKVSETLVPSVLTQQEMTGHIANVPLRRSNTASGSSKALAPDPAAAMMNAVAAVAMLAHGSGNPGRGARVEPEIQILQPRGAQPATQQALAMAAAPQPPQPLLALLDVPPNAPAQSSQPLPAAVDATRAASQTTPPAAQPLPALLDASAGLQQMPPAPQEPQASTTRAAKDPSAGEEMRASLEDALQQRDKKKNLSKLRMKPAAAAACLHRPAAAKKAAKAAKTPKKRPAGQNAEQLYKPGDTMKNFASRAYHTARRQAENKGLSEKKIYEAARAAHALATERWNADH